MHIPALLAHKAFRITDDEVAGTRTTRKACVVIARDIAWYAIHVGVGIDYWIQSASGGLGVCCLRLQSEVIS